MMMKSLLIILLASSMVAGCKNPGEKKQTDVAAVPGETLSLTTDQVLSDPASYANKHVIVNGMVSHVCKHGGQKMFLVSSDGEKYLRINTTGSIPEFPVDLEGSNIAIEGKVEAFEEPSGETESAPGINEPAADSGSLEYKYHKDNFYVIAAEKYTLK